MSAITEYPQLSRSLWPQHATDLVAYRQRANEQWPDLPRWTAIVSSADIATQRARGKTQVPLRNKHGERLSCIFDRLPLRAANAFAKRHGYPFTIHLANLDAAEVVTK